MKTFTTSPGSSFLLGVTKVPDGINFAIFSRHATNVFLLLFRSGEGPKLAEISFDPQLNRTGDIWHLLVHNTDPDLRYGYRMDGPFDSTR